MNAVTFTFETVHGVKQSFCLGLSSTADKSRERETQASCAKVGSAPSALADQDEKSGRR